MHHLLRAIAILELALAACLALAAAFVPGAAEVEGGFARAERVVGDAHHLVEDLRCQVRELRRPEFRELGDRLRDQSAAVSEALRSQNVNFETVHAMRDSLDDVAAALERFAATLEPAANADLRRTLSRASRVLAASSRQLDQVLQLQQDYEAAMRQSILIADTVAAMLPLVLASLEERLEQQEAALASLSASLDEVRAPLPEAGRSASRLFFLIRAALVLAGLIVGLHGGWRLAAPAATLPGASPANRSDGSAG